MKNKSMRTLAEKVQRSIDEGTSGVDTPMVLELLMEEPFINAYQPHIVIIANLLRDVAIRALELEDERLCDLVYRLQLIQPKKGDEKDENTDS